MQPQPDRLRLRFDLAIAAGVALIFGFYPLRSYDLWWHLASGREIWRLRQIPAVDPFSFASNRTEWLDHGWLFQVIAYPIHQLGGPVLLQLLQFLLVFAAVFLGARQLSRDGVSPYAAAFVLTLAFWLARPRLTLRPEVVTLLFLAILLTVLRQQERERRWPIEEVAILALAWINLHPGVMLGALVLGVWSAILLIQRLRSASTPRRALIVPVMMVASFAVPLIANPYTFDGVLFPFRLNEAVRSGLFINPEWLPATLGRLPLLYLTAGLLLMLFAWALRERRDDLSSQIRRGTILLLLAFFAFRYQRNVGVFAVSLPLLVGPELGRLTSGWSERRLRWLGAAAGFAALFSVLAVPPAVGVNRREIPIDAAEWIAKAGVRGRMFNQTRFGGYLIWRLYPQHKVLIDGRNEVYTNLLPRLMPALGDQRKWLAFLRDEQIEWAVVGFDNAPERVKLMAPDRSLKEVTRPFVYNHFPPSQWALVYWDDVAMILVRRGSANQHLEHLAPKYLWPERAEFLVEQVRSGVLPAGAVAAELEQASRLRPNVQRNYALAEALRNALR